VKQTVICVILRAFSQNCERDSIGEVSSFGEYGFLSGHVSATGEGCLPCVAQPRSQASADPSLVVSGVSSTTCFREGRLSQSPFSVSAG